MLFKIDLPPSTSTAVTSPTLPFLPPPHNLQLDLLKNVAIGSLRSFRTSLAQFHSLLLHIPRRVVTAVGLQHMHGVVDVAAAVV